MKKIKKPHTLKHKIHIATKIYRRMLRKGNNFPEVFINVESGKYYEHIFLCPGLCLTAAHEVVKMGKGVSILLSD